MEVCLDGFLRSIDDPGHNVGTGILVKVIRIVLDVGFSGDLGIERNNDQTPPDTIIVCTDLRQVVGIQHQGMGRNKVERVLILLLRLDFIGGTKLLYH